MPTFTPKLAVLPEGQRKLWPLLSTVPSHFVLYGGTGLALQLGHRTSVDFDFFTSVNFEPEELRASFAFLNDARTTQVSRDTLSCAVEFAEGQAQISFFGGLGLNYLKEPMRAHDNLVRVASLLDIGGMKAATVQRRSLSTDYIDIDALLAAGISLDALLAAARVIYGQQFIPEITLRALGYFEDLKGQPLPETAKIVLRRAVARVNLMRFAGSAGAREDRNGGT